MTRRGSLTDARFALIACALCFSPAIAAAEMVAVVAAKSGVTTLSRNQVMDVFLGKAIRFPDGTIAIPIDQAEGSAERNAFYSEFGGKSPAQIKAHWSKVIFTGRGRPPREVLNGVEVKKFIARNPGAIGYIDSTLVDGDVRVISER
ncbi:MAG: phosphate ABC transporter substrate-binding protein [Vicinamibacteria bacterium]